MFTRFPFKNPEVLAKLENAINKYDRKRKNWKASQYSRVCSKHFLKTDFINDLDRKLKFNAVPTVFNESKSTTTTPPEQSLTSLVNTLLDGYSANLANSQHLNTPVQDDVTSTKSVQSIASNIHVEANPADKTQPAVICKRARLQCEDLPTDAILERKNKEILKKYKKIELLHQKL